MTTSDSAPRAGSLASTAAGRAGSAVAGKSSDTQAIATAGRGVAGIPGGRAGSPGSTTATGGMSAPNVMTGAAGKAAVGGSPALAGSGAAGKGAAGMTAAAGASGGADGETGRMVGITAAHNVVRARIMSPKPEPALPPLKWSTDIAKIAQAYAEKLASGGNCLNLQHSMVPGYGENLAGYQGTMAKTADVVEGWAAEEECTTYGPITINGSECNATCAMEKHSNGCGHYTQVVWRGTTEVGCGMATCGSGRTGGEVWVCNYRQQGNVVGQKPY